MEPLGLLSQNDSLLMEGPALRGMYADGERPHILQKEQEGLAAKSLTLSCPLVPET